MRRRFRTRRVLKWVGLAGCVLLLAAFMASHRWEVWRRHGNVWLWMEQGHIGVYRSGWGAPPTSPVHGVTWSLRWGSPIVWDFRGGCVQMRIAIWLPLFALAILTAILGYLDRRPPKGHCQRCGYDLTGNVSGVCPECGEPI